MYELNPKREHAFKRLKEEMGVSKDSEVIDIMLKRFINVLDNESIAHIEYRDEYRDFIASETREWFFR